jgi:hypothetical protein
LLGPISEGQPLHSRTGVVIPTVQSVVGLVVGKWVALMRADGPEAHDVFIRADAGRHALAELQKHARRIMSG